MSAKSCWEECRVTADNQAYIRAWFMGLADGMNIAKAEILRDVETEREKKLRISGRRNGRDFVLTRTLGRRFTVSCKEART